MAARQPYRPRVVVLGDVVVDVVLTPATPLEVGTDVPGRVMLRQGGSGTTTARWLARVGTRASLVGAVGRDAEGTALIELVRGDGVTSRIVRIAGRSTGRIGVLVAPDGERSFVQDRAATESLSPQHLHESWFAGVELVHVPTYSLIGHPLGDAGRRAAELGHAAGGLVSIDLSSSRPLLALGRQAAVDTVAATRPDLIFAAGSEAEALVDRAEGLLDVAPIVVLKRGAGGATVLFHVDGATRRFEAAAHEVATSEVTGAGDAFDAGFIGEWLRARHDGRPPEAALRAAAAAGNRLAARHLLAPRKELRLV